MRVTETDFAKVGDYKAQDENHGMNQCPSVVGSMRLFA